MGVLDRVRREIDFIDGLLRTLNLQRGLSADAPLTVADELERVVDEHAAREAIRFEGASLSYAEFDRLANRVAHWGLSHGLAPGDTVALFMTNRPEFLAVWMGLSKIGVATALINSGLVGASLAHCVTIAHAKHLIASSDVGEAYAAALPHVAAPPIAWRQGGPAPATFLDLDAALAAQPDTRPDRAIRAAVKGGDLALLVYTSGTTGAPKAARMPQWRVIGMMRAFVGGGHATAQDRVYVTLPLYHATGGLTGVGFAFAVGGALLLRRKFSASHFWEDVVQERASVFFYIGELCRYLLNQPVSSFETQHALRLGVGNGLRPDIWEKFQERFKVPKLFEFYGSTEGNVNFMNFDGKLGAVGRIPKYLKKRLNVRIVRFDVETEQPLRGPDGLCIEAAPNEIGEAIGEIRTDHARFRFEGYSGDPKQTERKILRNVFRDGDAWFRTGDLMRQDEEGYFYFIDRIGDTFRWKGENVSTNVVGDALASFPGVLEANVYGVKIGEQDGRAGMAAVTLEPGVDLQALRAHLAKELAPFARPLFLRVQPQIETTGTFKYRKVDLVREGFDPTLVADPLYFNDPRVDAYVPVTPAVYAEIQAGDIRV